jgi:hypothetical protein
MHERNFKGGAEGREVKGFIVNGKNAVTNSITLR